MIHRTAASGLLCTFTLVVKDVLSTVMMPLVNSGPCSVSGGVKSIEQVLVVENPTEAGNNLAFTQNDPHGEGTNEAKPPRLPSIDISSGHMSTCCAYTSPAMRLFPRYLTPLQTSVTWNVEGV